MVNMLVENEIPMHIVNPPSREARECPGLNFVQRQRWWTPRHRGLAYASLCDSCYSRFRHEEDFKAITTANNCFCDGFLYGNLGGKKGPVNISFWKKSLKEYYPITESGVAIPAEEPFIIGIHVSLNEGQYYKYEILVDDQVVIPYGEIYHYQLSLASTGGTGGAAQFHMVPIDGHWQHLPRSFLINNLIIPDNSKIVVNIKLFESRKRKYSDSTDEFIGYYTYHRDSVSLIAAIKDDAPENASMVSIKTNHLTNTSLKIPHITMQPMAVTTKVIACFNMRAREEYVESSESSESTLFTDKVRLYRDAVTRRIRFMEVKAIKDDDAVAQMKATLDKLNGIKATTSMDEVD